MRTGFGILQDDNEADRSDWLSLWSACERREVYAHPTYAGLFAGEGAQALCAAFVGASGLVLYPLILRDLRREAYCHEELRDITSPYGYGGAFCSGDLTPKDIAAFWQGFADWAEEQQVVSEFVRFSLFDQQILQHPCESESIAPNIVRDVCVGTDELLYDMKHKVRKNIRRARESGVEIQVDEDGAHLDAFLTIYNATMDRRDATAGYYFPREFFESIIRDMSGHYAFFHARHEGHIVSTELVLASTDAAYSFLGGTDPESFALRPNDLLKLEIMLWARDRGIQSFVLGGGYEPDDGIYRYKLAFAPEGRRDFRVGRRIWRPDDYRRLVEARRDRERQTGREWAPRNGFFPAYRAPAAEPGPEDR